MGWEQEVAETARRYQALQDRVSAMSILEGTPDGGIRVTVSTAGLLTGLVLRGAAEQYTLDELAEEIMDCVRRAQARIPDVLRQAVIATVGAQDPSAHLIIADARERFPAPAPEPDPSPDPHTDWESRQVMEDV